MASNPTLSQIKVGNVVYDICDASTRSSIIQMQDSISQKADINHTHDVTAITSGNLPIAHGGTGASSVTQALTNLGIKMTKGYYNSRTDENGVSDVRHNLGVTPSTFLISPLVTTSNEQNSAGHYGPSTIIKAVHPVIWSLNTNQCQVRWWRDDQDRWVHDAQGLHFYWLAIQ